MDRLLASIFNGFWWVLGAKLGGKIEQRAKRNRLKTHRMNYEKKMRFGSPWVGGNKGRDTVAQGSWDPLITNF